MSALIWCPFPDRASARDTAARLLDEGLIACANILGDIESLFRWKGERGETNEVAVLFKTDSSLLEPAITRLASLHPYDTPAIMGWHCDAVPQATRAWLAEPGNRGEGT